MSYFTNIKLTGGVISATLFSSLLAIGTNKQEAKPFHPGANVIKLFSVINEFS
jgi:hypothetical protein